MRNFDYRELTGRSWDSEIIGLVAQIHEYKGRQELYLKQKPMELDRLQRYRVQKHPMKSKESARPIHACCSLYGIRQHLVTVMRKKSWVIVMC